MTKIAEITNFVTPYIKEGRASNQNKEAVDIYNHLSFHIDGYKYKANKTDNPYFSILIESRRPNESASIVEYRKKIYLPKTKQPCFKVLNSLKKIVKSQDWKIDYSKSKPSATVGKKTLQQYCEKDYPIFKSLENWLYSYATKEVIADPNGLIFIEPQSWNVKDGDLYNPVVNIVPTPKVIDFKENEYAFFTSQKKNNVVIDGARRDLPIYILITKEYFAYIKEINLDRDFDIQIIDIISPELPCFKTGGVYNKVEDGKVIYDSFINPMLPSLDAAARESSDLDAEVVQHIYSTMWYYSGNDCNNCQGSGKVQGEGEQIACKVCEGKGRMLKSPYQDIVIGKDGLGDGGVPTPPGGYIQKTTDIVTLQDTRIAAHTFAALGALNMEFLAQTPLNQSGTAKEVDRDELNNFVYGVAYHLVENILSRVYSSINNMRYGVLVKDEAVRAEQLPSINVPEKFDLLSTNALLDNFQKARSAKIDNSIINEYEIDVINKFFNNQPEVRDRLLLTKSLDPLKGIEDDEKTQLYQNIIITKEDYVASSYIDLFVSQLITNDPKFYEKPIEDQAKALKLLVDAKVKELDTSEVVKNELIPPTPPNE